MDARCPHCRTLLEISPKKAGRRQRCPECQGVFQAPLPVGRTPKQGRAAFSCLGFLLFLFLLCGGVGLLGWAVNAAKAPSSAPAAAERSK